MPIKDPAKKKAYAKRHYELNKPAYVARAMAHNVKVGAELKAFIHSYLSSNPCVDCGEDDRIVLEFDHRPGVLKKFNIADAVTQGYALKTVQAEIAKCDVRCANCHRRVTFHRANSMRQS